MKKFVSFICMALMASVSVMHAETSNLYDYQNYNHGYCPECECSPCTCQPSGEQTTCPAACSSCEGNAPVCGTECGISICALGVAVAALAAAAAIIISSGNGSTSHN